MQESGAPSATAALFRRLPAEQSWGELVDHIAHGDESAFANLYDATCRMVHGVATRILGNEADAEEVTLDVYNQVWRTARTFQSSRGTVTAWLLTLSRTRSLDKLRSRASRQRNTESMSDRFDAPASIASPEEQSAASQQRKLLLSALDRLPAEQRQALEMAYFDGLSHSELADRLGEPLGTVKTRIRLGMMKLKDHLQFSVGQEAGA
jgi:RNA polymerase sigma-70 factor (ECF subfamily)